MRKILFVDDDPRILEALKILLRRNRERWDMSFALGGEAAVQKLQEEYFDVIVSDMRMPGIDGAALLKRVQDEHPHMLRIVLTAYTDLESVLRVVPVAQQFMIKPCDVAELENAIERACSMQELIPDPAIRRMVGKIDRLRSLPHVYSALTRTLSEPEAAAADVVRILKQDIAICAKLLQLANSSFFQLAKRITSVEYAVVYLGFNMVKNLVLSSKLARADKSSQDVFSVDLLHRHSLATANLAARLLGTKEKCEDAFMAGLLHDIGKLVFAQEYPEHLERIRTAMRADSRPEFILEQELAGVTHAEVGAYLLALWGLPDSIVQAVAHHHRTDRITEGRFDVLSATYVANHLANENTPLSPIGTENRQELEESYLAGLGVSNKLGAWRQIAFEQAMQAKERK